MGQLLEPIPIKKLPEIKAVILFIHFKKMKRRFLSEPPRPLHRLKGLLPCCLKMLQQELEQQLLRLPPPEGISNAKAPYFNPVHRATTYASHLLIFDPHKSGLFPHFERLSHKSGAVILN